MTHTPASSALADLARAHGVATEYWDWQGRHSMVSSETIHAVLGALGVEVGDDDSARIALDEVWKDSWRRTLPPFTMARLGEGTWVSVHVPHGAPLTVWAILEDGRKRELPQVDHWVDPRVLDGRLTGEATFSLPIDLPLGWHTLYAESPDQPLASASLVIAPTTLPLPPAVADAGAFGLMSQIYSVRSARSWGVGDFADLADMATWSARELGADFTLINPVHAAEPVAPMEPSPYLPTTRRFVNPIYLRVEDVPELAYVSTDVRTRVEEWAAAGHALNSSSGIARDDAWDLKKRALRLLFAQPSSPRRRTSFEAYCEREGQGLLDFATWCALTEKYGSASGDWPEELGDAHGPAVEAERALLGEDIAFYRWLQWLLDEQLAKVQADCLAAGMSLGIVQDLAVGVHPEGADAWGLGDALARAVTVGAPPDPYNQLGQDWSQPPWRPDQLREMAYRPYRDMIRAALRHSGGLRIDHIIGLFRLWWIPEGHSPIEGTYVRYDHEAIIGILVLEASRAGAVIVGEDLGTVEPWVRDYLSERGIFGTSILWFERTDDGRPRRPEEYRRLCLASVTTHDLPPTAGYLQGEHMRIRESLGLFTRSVEVEHAADEADRATMTQALAERGLVKPDAGVEATVEALHRYLSWTPALLLGVAVPDLVGDVQAMNQPGTDEEYPNWRLPLSGPDRRPLMLEDLLASPRAKRIARCVHRGRRPS